MTAAATTGWLRQRPAVSAYSGQNGAQGGNLFAASLAKPLNKTALLDVMQRIGFKIAHQDTKNAKVTIR